LSRKHLLKHIIEGKIEGMRRGEDEKEDISRFWMFLRKQQVTEIWKAKRYVELYGELAIEGKVDLS
jgi:hypothetical protein